MAEGSISTSGLPLYVLNGLFYSFCEETISKDNVFKTTTMLVNLATKLTMTVGVFFINTQMPVMI